MPDSNNPSAVETLIAVVDDEETVGRAIARLVRAEGYAVTAYRSGEKLLQDLYTISPACILLDLHMPEMGGLEVLASLHHRGCKIPVIVITADQNPQTLARALEFGAVACLNKPVDSAQLFGLIHATVHGRK